MIDAGLGVTVVPGPSAALAALVVSGLPTDRFSFEGFLPRTGSSRRRLIGTLAAEQRTVVVFEAPGRVAATLSALAAACGPDRPAAVVREITKVHEDVWRGSLGELAPRAAAAPPRGEVVVVVGGAPGGGAVVTDEVLVAALRDRLVEQKRTRGVVDEVADIFGVSRRRVYELALAISSPGRKDGVDPPV